MKKIKETVKRELKKAYETMCNNYRDELLRMWELDAHYGYWNSDQPGTIYHYERGKDISMLQKLHVTDCIECGCCTYICAGRLDLTQSIKMAKAQVNALRAKK